MVAVRAEPGAAAMWDLTVSNVHTFAVGNGAYVVHNCGDGEGRKFWRKGNGGEPPKGSDLITEDRPGRSADIKPDANDDVHPAANGKKGYSVFDKPGAFGNADEWYYATENDLPDGIKLTWNENPNPRGFTHGTLGPSESMSRGRFEDLFDQIPWRR